MREYWHIVPVNDGFTVLCRDFNNIFYLGRKEACNFEDELEFDSEEEAQTYINDWFAPQYYKTEKFWILGKEK